MGAGNRVTSCDLGVFADQAAELVPAHNMRTGDLRGRALSPGGRPLLQRPVWPVRVVVVDILIKDEPRVPLAGDQHPVEALAAGAGNPALRDRVRARRLDRCLDDSLCRSR